MEDCPSKAHRGAIHSHVRPYYLHMEQSPRTLLRSDKPSSRRGCVELLGSPYYKGVPLPQIPSIRKLGTNSRIAQRSEYASVEPDGQFRRSVGTAQYAATNRKPRSRTVLRYARHSTGIIRSGTCTTRRGARLSRAPARQ